MSKPRVKAPNRAKTGEIVTLKCLISHKMESGQRKDSKGNTVPRSIINRFTAEYNGETVVDVEVQPSVSTNPYFSFDAKCAKVPGVFDFKWYDDDGSIYKDSKKVKKG